MHRVYVAIGALNGLTAVAAGAFAAHALRDRWPAEDLEVFEVAARYQMYHALALVAVGCLVSQHPRRTLHWAAWFFLAGTLLFSGTLYALAISGMRSLAHLTPLGGGALLIAWLLLGVSALRR